MKKILISVCSLVLLALGGCASTPTKPNRDLAEIKLTEAATSVSQSLQQLAEIEQAVHPDNHYVTPPDPMTYGMAAPASVDWTGPVDTLVKRLASVTGYRLDIMGKKPAVPVIVTIHAKNTPVGNILRDAGFQCGKRANIVVYPSRKLIELRYAAI